MVDDLEVSTVAIEHVGTLGEGISVHTSKVTSPPVQRELPRQSPIPYAACSVAKHCRQRHGCVYMRVQAGIMP